MVTYRKPQVDSRSLCGTRLKLWLILTAKFSTRSTINFQPYIIFCFFFREISLKIQLSGKHKANCFLILNTESHITKGVDKVKPVDNVTNQQHFSKFFCKFLVKQKSLYT